MGQRICKTVSPDQPALFQVGQEITSTAPGARLRWVTETRTTDVVEYIRERIDVAGPVFLRLMGMLMNARKQGKEITLEVVDRAIAQAEADEASGQYRRPVLVYSKPKQVRGRPRTSKARFVASGPVVYYMRIGARVKIGWSSNLQVRLRNINPEELLAVEAGGLQLERQRHQQFGSLRTHGEWFKYEGALRRHVEKIRLATPGAHGDDVVSII